MPRARVLWNDIKNDITDWIKKYLKKRMKQIVGRHVRYEILDNLFEITLEAIQTGKLGSKVQNVMIAHPMKTRFMVATAVNVILASTRSEYMHFDHK